ncbi:MAG TPA: enolase C-terminal domain-like protein [Woeseiaceae bacterium]|nr:enolase C-terminal domain-like protein [Woeseiaceae bacterium]
MPLIDFVEIHEIAWDAPGLSMDSSGFNIVCKPGASIALRKFVIAIGSEDGSRGEYAALWGGSPNSLAQVLTLAPHLLGRDALERELIGDDFKRFMRHFDRMGIGPIDIALWDLAGKRSNQSVSEMLGGYRKRLPAYASTYHGDRNGALSTPEDYVNFAEHCHSLGFTAFKMHGWTEGNVAEEVETVRQLGKQLGGRMHLMLDPASELRTFADALAVGRACDEAGFYWLEDPMRDGGSSAHLHRKLRQMIRTPLLQGEHVRGLELKADLVKADGTDFLRSDPEYDMGITGAMKIAHLGEAFGLDVEIHASGPAHRHCMSAMRNSNYYELALVGPNCRNALPPIYACGYSDEMDAVGPDGCVDVPTGPGLGVIYDWDWIHSHQSAVHTFR